MWQNSERKLRCDKVIVDKHNEFCEFVYTEDIE